MSTIDRLRRRLRGSSDAPPADAPSDAPTAGSADASAAPSAAPFAAPAARSPRPEIVEARRLAGDGAVAAAVDLLADANRRERDPDIEIALIDLRRQAATHLAEQSEPREPWPPVYADPFPEVSGRVPEVARDEVDVAVVGGAVAHHGAVIVRNLFAEDQAASVRDAIDLAHEANAAEDRPVDAAFSPMRTENGLETQVLRNMVMTHGGVWLADSPRATAVALDALHEVGAVEMMTAHFGARPFFSLQKSTLRRSQPEWRMVAWHQDGAFYDADVRTMNIWVALSPCGGDRPTPGLEIVPKRMAEILPVDGVMSKHSIDYDLVDRIAEDTPTVIPTFEPGDALIFDERLVHRTHLPEQMTDVRYALECWFFAPSHATSEYVPLLV